MAEAKDSPAIRLYNAGAEHFRKGEVGEAIGCFKRSTEADAGFYRAWAYLGMAYAEQGQLDPAIEAYRKCIDIAPQYHKAFNNVGELYRRKGLLDYAAMVFKMASEIDPSQAHYFYNLGITYFEIGMYPQAEEAFTRALALDTADYEYVTELAQVQFTLRKYEAAAATLETFLQAHPAHERSAETGARLAMLKRRIEQEKALAAQAKAAEEHKSEIRRVPIEDDGDENAKTKFVERGPDAGPDVPLPPAP
jgi:tetratricopeptide (TPR) repeat protein